MKKYNGIIKGFTKTIKKLENLASTNAAETEKNLSAIFLLKNKNNTLDAEGNMAATTARKLSELIGG